MHPTVRASFNGTRFDQQGLRRLFIGLSGIIGTNYGNEGWQQWRDGYVASPNPVPLNPEETDKGGMVVVTGWNGGIRKGEKEALNSPNGAFVVVSDIRGQRWFTEYREMSTLPTAAPLNTTGKWEGCPWPTVF
jgi:hypothetical protein